MQKKILDPGADGFVKGMVCMFLEGCVAQKKKDETQDSILEYMPATDT